MKFLLELVSCCGCQEKGGFLSEVPPLECDEPKMEETKSLVTSVRRNYRRRRRGRLGGDGGLGQGEWKPSLCSISEDNVVMERERDRSSETERLAKRKSGGGGSHKARPRVRSHSHEFGGNSVTNVIPAFSPTPFMF